MCSVERPATCHYTIVSIEPETLRYTLPMTTSTHSNCFLLTLLCRRAFWTVLLSPLLLILSLFIQLQLNLPTSQNCAHSMKESNCEINWLNLSLLATKTPIYKYFQQLSSCDLNSVLLVYRTVHLRSFYFIVIWYEFVYRRQVYLIVHRLVDYCQCWAS